MTINRIATIGNSQNPLSISAAESGIDPWRGQRRTLAGIIITWILDMFTRFRNRTNRVYSPQVLRPRLHLTALEHRAVPAAFVVDSNADSGAGSLRDQIAAANAAAGLDTISFDASVFAAASTILLTSGQIDITDDLILNGPSSKLTLNGNAKSRIFNVAGTVPLSISLNALTLTNGFVTTGTGGAIIAGDDSINLANCELTNNLASMSNGGAINITAGGTVLAIDCTFIGNKGNNGGALSAGGIGSVDATLIIQRCTLSGNIANFDGGAINTDGYILVAESTLAGNSSANPTGGGGAIRHSGQFNSPTVIVRNSTLSGNTATGSGGAIRLFSSTGPLNIQNSTIFGNTANGSNGGGISREGGTTLITIESSIVSQNVNAASPDLFTTGTLNANASLIGATTGVTTFAGDAFTNTNLGVDPLLGPLASNGGALLTHLPASTSKAIGNGSNLGSLSTDQRGTGFVRSYNGTVDIGAVEFNQRIVTNTSNSAGGSLRQTIIDAESSPGNETITFDATVFATAKTITLTSALPTIFSTMAIQGTGASKLTVRRDTSAAQFGIFTLGNGAPGFEATLTVTGMTISSGSSADDGGAFSVLADRTLILDGVLLSAHKAADDGGAIYLDEGTVILRNSLISGSSAGDNGGGIRTREGVVIVENSSLSGNTATNIGGGLYANGANDITLINTTISTNTAKTGGGIRLNSASGTLVSRNCTITANRATTNNGGGLFVAASSSAISFESCIVAKNIGTGNPDIVGAATPISLKNSLVGNFAATLNDLGGNLPIGTDPLLNPLANNGGIASSHFPSYASPALNNGSNPSGLTTDQRGLPRDIGGVDIGAVEVPNALVVTNADDSGTGSLRDIITLANAAIGPDRVTFEPTFFATSRTISLLTTLPIISGGLTIQGTKADLLTIRSDSGSLNILSFTSPSSITSAVSDVTLTAGSQGINAQNQRLTLDRVVITDHKSASGIFVDDSFLTVRNSVISKNNSNGNGGGIRALDSSVFIENSTLSGNTCTLRGGAVNAIGVGFFSMLNSTVSGNSATGHGGGLYIDLPGSHEIYNSTISGNTTSDRGGGICIISGNMFAMSLDVFNSTVTANKATVAGGGIATLNSTPELTVQSSVVAGNIRAGSPDISSSGSDVFVGTSLIGSTSGFTLTELGGNLPVGTDPQLAPLADNGGPTLTHAPLPGSPLLNKGSNAANATTDQRGFARQTSTGVDIGAVEIQQVIVQNVTINDGSAQRSRVTSITVDFGIPVVLPANPADAFQLKRQSDNAIVSLAVTQNSDTVTLTFTGGPLDFGSLADGRYTLTINSLEVNAGGLDGNQDGTPGDDYVLIGSTTAGTPKLFRLFGDADGNGTVNTGDFNAFRSAFGGSNPIFDFDNAGGVGTADFNQFRTRFGSSV